MKVKHLVYMKIVLHSFIPFYSLFYVFLKSSIILSLTRVKFNVANSQLILVDKKRGICGCNWDKNTKTKETKSHTAL